MSDFSSQSGWPLTTPHGGDDLGCDLFNDHPRDLNQVLLQVSGTICCLPCVPQTVTDCLRLSQSHRLSHTVIDCFRLSQTVTGCLTLSPTVTGCLTLSPTVTVCLTLSQTVSDCLRLSQAISHCHRLSHTVTDCHRLLQAV